MSSLSPSFLARSNRAVLVALLALVGGACGSEPIDDRTSVQDDQESAGSAARGPEAPSSSPEAQENEGPKQDALDRLAAKAAARLPAGRLDALKADLALTDRDTLRPVGVETEIDGGTSVRAAHYHDGLRVIGSSVIVHIDEKGDVRDVTRAHAPHIDISTSPAIEPGKAVLAVRVDPERLPYRKEPKAELAILPVKHIVRKDTGLPPGPEDRYLSAD